MIDPTSKASVNPIADSYSKQALNPQPQPPKALPAFTDGAVIAASARFDAVSLNPQPLPPKEITLPGEGAIMNRAGIAMAALKDVTFAPVLPRQIGNMVSDILDKVALNPQPLPPKAVGNVVADVLSRIGIIIVSGRDLSGTGGPGTPVMQQEEDEMPPAPKGGRLADQKLQQAGIIIVSGRDLSGTGGPGTPVMQPEEDEMQPPSPKGDELSLGLRSLSAFAMTQLISEAIANVSLKPRL